MENQFGLFGYPTPEEIRDRIGKTDKAEQLQMAQLDPAGHMFMMGSGAGKALGGLFAPSTPDPRVIQAQNVQGLSKAVFEEALSNNIQPGSREFYLHAAKRFGEGGAFDLSTRMAEKAQQIEATDVNNEYKRAQYAPPQQTPEIHKDGSGRFFSVTKDKVQEIPLAPGTRPFAPPSANAKAMSPSEIARFTDKEGNHPPFGITAPELAAKVKAGEYRQQSTAKQNKKVDMTGAKMALKQLKSLALGRDGKPGIFTAQAGDPLSRVAQGATAAWNLFTQKDPRYPLYKRLRKTLMTPIVRAWEKGVLTNQDIERALGGFPEVTGFLPDTQQVAEDAFNEMETIIKTIESSGDTSTKAKIPPRVPSMGNNERAMQLKQAFPNWSNSQIKDRLIIEEKLNLIGYGAQ